MKHDSIKNWRYALVNGGILILAVLLLTACGKTNIDSDDADGLLQDMTESVETEPVDPLDSLLERGDLRWIHFPSVWQREPPRVLICR